MNYLAHTWLWPDNDSSLAGSLLGDFIHGPLTDALPSALSAAVRLHRQVDRYTDAHSINTRLRASVPDGFRRYAGIVLDMLYDHLLARDFAQWHSEPLSDFAARVYQAMNVHEGYVPEQRLHRWRYLRDQHLLNRYVDLSQVQAAIHGIGRRLSRATPLLQADEQVLDLLQQLEPDYAIFLKDLQQFVAIEKARINQMSH